MQTRVIADLHLHSRFARACSNAITLKNLEKYGRMKGLTLLGTGDAQHPKWFEELKSELKDEHSTGIYSSATGQNFLLQTELSLVFTHAGKGRRIHNVVLLPSIESVAQLQEALLKRGRIDYDGRPIFGMSCAEFVEMLRNIDKRIEVIPAHAWTPWFGLFGSKSGFDSIKEGFQEQAKHIHAIETGISSDPGMNWRLSQLDNIQIVSFSDSHSHWPWRIGRECTVFDVKEVTYDNILKAIRTGEGLASTIEFFPEEGKYHYDGHRDCGVMFSPEQSKKHHNLCPKCTRPLTIGVLNRIEELADRPEGFKLAHGKPFLNLMPLSEVIAASLKAPVMSKKVWELYYKLMEAFGNELNVLLDAKEHELHKIVDERLAGIILKNRSQQIKFRPGYDGVYGEPLIDGEAEGHTVRKEEDYDKPSIPRQTGLKEF